MNHLRRIRIFLFFLTLIFLLGCDNKPLGTGILWFGDGQQVALFNLQKNTVAYPSILSGFTDVAVSPTEENYLFVSKNDNGFGLASLSIGQDALSPTGVWEQSALSDLNLSVDATRAVFRVLRSGDVYDAYLYFKGSRHAKIAGRIGAVCFASDNKTLFLGQGDKVAAHVIDDVTRPDKMPSSGLSTLVSGPGTARDIAFHIGLKRLAVCFGNQVITCDLTGGDKKILYDAIDSELPGPLLLPYRVRWSKSGDNVAVLVSPDGEKGAFVLLNQRDPKPVMISGIHANVGGFAWTESVPVAIW